MYKMHNNITFVNICLWESCVMIPILMTPSSLRSSSGWSALLGYATLKILACWIPSYNMVIL